ncbi:MAG: hypothetical protein ACT4PZ_19980 [Panacagrimonas sp.]
MRLPRYRSLLVAAVGLSAFNARAASLTDLYAQVPSPPADVTTALSWMDKGQIVSPEYTRFKKALEAERSAIAALNGGTLPEITPAAPLDATEPPELQGAWKSYNDYLANNEGNDDPAKRLGKRTRWLQAAMGGKLGSVLPKVVPCPSVPCTDPAIIAKNEPVQAQKYQLATQDISLWTTLFEDWKKGRSAIIDKAQGQIAAAGEGAKAAGATGRTTVARYRAAMLKEIEVALSVTELSLKRAYAIETGQYDAVSSSTRSAKAATK